jgi:hypothetical protein
LLAAVALQSLAVARVAWADDERPVQVVVEIDRRAARSLNDRLTRRLIELELGELEVPPPVGEDETDASLPSRSLFVRVLGEGDDQLRVELWEHGVFHGARLVAVGEGTSAQLRARRIALTAATLGRRLRISRIREGRLAAERARLEAEAERAAQQLPPPSRVALGAHARAAVVGPRGFWLTGPGLEGQIRLAGGERLDLGVSWLTGTAPVLDGSPPLQWLELSAAPGYAFRLSERLDLVTGLEFAAAAVHVSRVVAVDDIAQQRDTWSSRAVGRVLFEWDAAPRAHLRFGPELGASLRRIPAVDRTGEAHRLGGLWLGASVGWELDPHVTRGARQDSSPTRVAAGSETALPSDLRRGSSLAPPQRRRDDSRAP